jgi:hypothetical protein
MTRAEFDSLTDGDLVSLDDTAQKNELESFEYEIGSSGAPVFDEQARTWYLPPAGADMRRKLLRVIGPVPGGILAVEAVILTDPAKVRPYTKQGG